MRIVLPLIVLVAFGLAGCVTPNGGELPDFERSCPAYHASPGNPKWSVRPWVQDSTSDNPDVREVNQRDKWIVTPTLIKANPYEYANGTLDFIELRLNVEVLADAKIEFKVYESAKGEPAAYNSSKMTKDEFYKTTGPQVVFRDMNVQGARYLATLSFGPASGHDEENIIRDVGGVYRIEWTDGQGDFDPHNLRVDAFFTADTDKDPETASLVIYDITASLWYRHHDCV